MEEAATRIVHFLRNAFEAAPDTGRGDAAAGNAVSDTRVDAPTAAPACVLVRLFVTVPYAELEPDLQRCARAVLGGTPAAPAMKCLTLLGTAGDQPEWNSRHESVAHRALPLASEASVARSPMIAQLVSQFGLEVGTLLAPDRGLMLDAEQHTYNVFYVPEAKGSPHIPAQREFVIPFGIRSVLGFGGLLPSGELFAIVLFARYPIPRQTADLFRTLALNAKVALLPLVGGRRFA